MVNYLPKVSQFSFPHRLIEGKNRTLEGNFQKQIGRVDSYSLIMSDSLTYNELHGSVSDSLTYNELHGSVSDSLTYNELYGSVSDSILYN